jgi:hypothetical protein
VSIARLNLVLAWSVFHDKAVSDGPAYFPSTLPTVAVMVRVRCRVLGEEPTSGAARTPISTRSIKALIDWSRIEPGDLFYLARLYKQNDMNVEAEEMYLRALRGYEKE